MSKMQTSSLAVIREVNGEVKAVGVKEEVVESYEQLMTCLQRGSNNRSVGSTKM